MEDIGHGYYLRSRFVPIPTLTQVRLHEEEKQQPIKLSKKGLSQIRNPETKKWINVGGKTYNRLLREGKISSLASPATPSASLQPVEEGAGASPVKGHGIETAEALPITSKQKKTLLRRRRKILRLKTLKKMKNIKRA